MRGANTTVPVPDKYARFMTDSFAQGPGFAGITPSTLPATSGTPSVPTTAGAPTGPTLKQGIGAGLMNAGTALIGASGGGGPGIQSFNTQGMIEGQAPPPVSVPPPNAPATRPRIVPMMNDIQHTPMTIQAEAPPTLNISLDPRSSTANMPPSSTADLHRMVPFVGGRTGSRFYQDEEDSEMERRRLFAPTRRRY